MFGNFEKSTSAHWEVAERVAFILPRLNSAVKDGLLHHDFGGGLCLFWHWVARLNVTETFSRHHGNCALCSPIHPISLTTPAYPMSHLTGTPVSEALQISHILTSLWAFTYAVPSFYNTSLIRFVWMALVLDSLWASLSSPQIGAPYALLYPLSVTTQIASLSPLSRNTISMRE